MIGGFLYTPFLLVSLVYLFLCPDVRDEGANECVVS